VSLRSGLNTRSQPRLSIVVSGWRESQFCRRQRPVNRPLGFCHGLGFGGSSPPYGNACVERDRPFPHVPSNALNDAILDAAIFHVVKHTFDLCPLCLRPASPARSCATIRLIQSASMSADCRPERPLRYHGSNLQRSVCGGRDPFRPRLRAATDMPSAFAAKDKARCRPVSFHKVRIGHSHRVGRAC
jgi:hypothetical protein